MLVDRQLYHQVGGLAGSFVQGDFEDSDLCLRLRAQGRRTWYVPQVELYHLEGQSYPDELRRTVATYNGWLQTMTWDDDLTTLMTEFAVS
jgi:GT2 family glycosyltransferase